MKRSELTVEPRSEIGKSAARRLRAGGKTPAVVYGHGIEPVPVAVETRGFLHSVTHAGHGGTIINLTVKGHGEASGTAMVKAVAREPITGQLLNIDFQRIQAGEKVTAPVPVVVVGESPAQRVGGVLEHLAHEVNVHCLPDDLPGEIRVDISQLNMGQAIRVSDLEVPPGVEITNAPEEVVVLVAQPRVVVEEAAPAPEEAAPAEGEAAAPEAEE